MSIMKTTLIGMQNYLNDNEHSLFDNLVFPDGINKEDVCDNILLDGGEFEPIYGDPYFMRDAISLWGRKHYRTFQKWIEALNIDYAPLENYDRIEDWTDTENGGVSSSGRTDSGNTRTFNNQDKRTLDTQNKRTLDTEDKETLDTQNKRTLDTEDKETLDTQNKRTLDTNTTTENTVSAFDSSSYQPSDKSDSDNTGTDTMDNTGTDTIDHTGTDTMDNTGTDTVEHTGTDTMDNTGTDTVDYSGTIKDEYGEGRSNQETRNNKSVHGGRIHGNIGVTTSQQMLQAELDIAKWNITQQITDLFITEFCIMLYT